MGFNRVRGFSPGMPDLLRTKYEKQHRYWEELHTIELAIYKESHVRAKPKLVAVNATGGFKLTKHK